MASQSDGWSSSSHVTLKSALLTLLSFSMCGCAVTRPYLKDVAALPKCYEEALTQADGVRDEAIEKQRQLHDFEFWSGAALIGTGIATAGLGLYGASHDALVGTALGAGAIAAGRAYVPVGTRKGIYTEALQAIQTAKDETTLEAQMDAPQLVSLRTNSPFSFSGTVLAQMRRRYTDAQNSAARLAAAVKTFNEERHLVLHKSLRNIVATVNRAIASEVLDPDAALVEALKPINEAKNEIATNREQGLKQLERFHDLQDLYEVSKGLDQQQQSNVRNESVQQGETGNNEDGSGLLFREVQQLELFFHSSP